HPDGVFVKQVDCHRFEALMFEIMSVSRHADDAPATLQHPLSDFASDSGTGPGDNGGEAFLHHRLLYHMKSWMLPNAASKLTRSTRLRTILSSPSSTRISCRAQPANMVKASPRVST